MAGSRYRYEPFANQNAWECGLDESELGPGSHTFTNTTTLATGAQATQTVEIVCTVQPQVENQGTSHFTQTYDCTIENVAKDADQPLT